MWDGKADKTLHTLAVDPVTRAGAASFRSDGKQLAVAFGIGGPPPRPAGVPPPNAHVLVFDVATGKRVERVEYTPSPQPEPFTAAALAPDGKTAAVAGGIFPTIDPGTSRRPSQVWLWDAATRKVREPVGVLAPLRRALTVGLRYLPDGRHMIAAGNYGVRLWDVETDKLYESPEVAAPDGGDVRASFTPVPGGVVYVATVARKGTVQVWKVTSPPARKP